MYIHTCTPTHTHLSCPIEILLYNLHVSPLWGEESFNPMVQVCTAMPPLFLNHLLHTHTHTHTHTHMYTYTHTHVHIHTHTHVHTHTHTHTHTHHAALISCTLIHFVIHAYRNPTCWYSNDLWQNSSFGFLSHAHLNIIFSLYHWVYLWSPFQSKSQAVRKWIASSCAYHLWRIYIQWTTRSPERLWAERKCCLLCCTITG